MLTNPPFALNLTPEPTVPRNVLYRNAGGGFGSQSSQLSDILVDVEGEGSEGGKVKRVGMSKYWDATQSQGDVEVEVEGESEEKCPAVLRALWDVPRASQVLPEGHALRRLLLYPRQG